ncbi:MAG: TIM barrel protein [Candidatus Krumholzibacteriia bacterium]
MIGLQTALLPAADWRDGLARFETLAREFDLRACELHLATDHYAAACPTSDAAADEIAARLRPAVARLGVHLPFARFAGTLPGPLAAGLGFAARAGADAAIVHLRGGAETAADWIAVVAPLAALARTLGVPLCLENADDARDPALVRAVAAAVDAQVCLDVGHLHERIYPARGLRRKLLVANDRYSPRPFACAARLPAGARGWARALDGVGGRPAWVHLHDHDGRVAHRPLGAGRIDWTPLAGLHAGTPSLPLILEVDHRERDPAAVRADLRRLKELLAR